MTQKQLINEIRKERRRVQQNVRRMEKRGFFFDDFEIPSIEYTKSGNVSKKTLNKLKALTPRNNCLWYFMKFSSCKNKNYIHWWFF